MSKRAQFLNNLSLLASIYDHRAFVFLKKAEEEVAQQQLPVDLDNFFDRTSMRALKEYCLDHGVNNQNMIDWIIINKTVLSQFNISWDYLGEGLIGDIDGIRYQLTNRLLKNNVWEPVAYLAGNVNMPAMKIYKEIVESSQEIPLSSFTKEIGHYGFLVTTISKLFRYSGKLLPDIVKQLIDNNSEKLTKIRSQFQTEPRILGAGIDGLAFSIGPHRIIKFFKSKYAYDSAIKAVNRLFTTPDAAGTEAMIYDYGILSISNEETLYYYIMEKMAPLMNVMDNDILRTLWGKIRYNYNKNQVNNWKNQLKDPKNVKLVSQEIKNEADTIENSLRSNNRFFIQKLEYEIPKVEEKMAEFFPEDIANINKSGKSFKINPNWLNKIIEEILWKYTTGRDDLHGGNVGVTSFGDFRFFDPSYTPPSSY